MRDNFSAQSATYAAARPGYPDRLIETLLEQVPARGAALDCGTGNGQLAVKLAPHFNKVFATDISAAQLQHAPRLANVIYSQESAEATSFADRQFDLVTVAQAVHWFSFDAFYREVYRIMKDDGLFAVVGYGLPQISPAVDTVIAHFYKSIVGPYWDAERRYIDEEYKTIPFPFEEVRVPEISDHQSWTKNRLYDYLASWSAVQHYKKANISDPLDLIRDALDQAWGERDDAGVKMRILFRAGKKRAG